MNGTTTKDRGGFTLPEVMVAIAISVVVVFTALAGWEIAWRHSSEAATAAKVSKEAFGVMRQIEEEINRGQTVTIPDAAHAGVPSIEIGVPTATGVKRRAFRLVDGAVIMDLKDEGAAPTEIFDHVTALTFQALDPPTNSMVQINVTCTFNGRPFALQTVSVRRN